MSSKLKKSVNHFFKKLQFGKTSEDILSQGTFENLFNSLFASKESEKKKIIDILAKKKIDNLLFYTDIKNLEHIIHYGLEPLNRIKLRKNEHYTVGSYLQKDDSISLEFELSTRAHFGKGTNDIDFDPNNIAVIGVSPTKLFRLTKKDGFFDKSLNIISVSEVIQPEAIEGIMVRDEKKYLINKEIIKNTTMAIDLYLANKEQGDK